ncbi:hypothetical protein POTOM_033185 [Populus tomentosa]|uniref:Sialate O-acetylesterase domain-containing protein n=1 Tax=Populus tomentosa TaxID=118781 RepID=A0A8X7Z520_POPTO|nr:hypothetical protein POTOM_033185 [Populus tomentosa]
MEEVAQSTKTIFVFAGQSNMSGRGGVIKDSHKNQKLWDRVVPLECQPHPNILRLSANLKWEPASEQIHADIDTKKECGVGPCMSFANAVRERITGIVGLVPCAVGGTAIKEWARGEELYENMVKRAKESVKDGGEIKGLLWFQGESDTSTQIEADAYQGNMEKLIENVREDLGLPSLPIIQVAIASGLDDNYMEKVREAQLNINLPNVVCVDAKGLDLKEDHLHLTTESQTLWYQGERGTSHIHDAEVYQRNMEKLIEDVREVLGLPSLPITIVAIISGDCKCVEKVREARPGINLPNVVSVDAKGLHLKEDHLQLTAESQVKLGYILADAYLKDSASSLLALLKIKGIDCPVFDSSGFCTVLLISLLFLPLLFLLIAGF